MFFRNLTLFRFPTSLDFSDLDAHLGVDGGNNGGANGLGEFLERIAKEHHDAHGKCELVADDLGLDRRLGSRGLG